MPDKGQQARGRVRPRTLLLAGGAATVVAAAIALGAAGTDRSGGRQGSSRQAVDTLGDATAGHDAATSARPWHKSGYSSTSPAPVSPALPHTKTPERDDGRRGTKHVGAARHRAHINNLHGRDELLRPRPLAGPAADRHAPQSSPRARRAARDPRPDSRGTSGHGRFPSLIAMKCDELFPPHKREFRLRNFACHRLLG
jgi:hypothetical protein